MICFRVRPIEGKAESPSQGRLFFAAALPALLLYVSTLAPTVTPEDSGELITAAYTLGIAHPPGYPLWCILGKLFTLIPLGSVAWRVNLLSAVLGAVAVGTLAIICQRFTRSFSASLVSALVFAASRDFWSQCVVTEVYTLNVLFILTLLLFALRYEDTGHSRWLYFGAFTLGLGLTNHSTLGPLSVLFFGWVFLRHLDLWARPLLLLNLAGSFLVGLSIILYLPIRSATDPFLDWGKPETISAAIDHFLRRQYTKASEPRPRTILGQVTLVLHFLETAAVQFTPPACALAVLGALENWRRERKTFFFLAILFGLTSYGFIWLLNYPPDRENLHLTRVFFLPAHAVAAIWMALALRWVSAWTHNRFPLAAGGRRFSLGFAGLCLVLMPVVSHFRVNDQRGNYLAEDWGRNILQSLKPDAIVLPSADHCTFPLLYLQTVDGLRRDVLVGDKYGYIEDRVFRDIFRGREGPRVAPPLGGTPFEKQRYLIEQSGRPVYFSTKSRIPGLEGHELVTSGLLFEALPKGAKPDEAQHKRLWAGFRFCPRSLEELPGDFSQDLILSDYHYARGRYALLFSHDEEAIQELQLAEWYGFGIKEIHNNLGGTLAEAGKPELALSFLKNALKVEPKYDMAIRNMASALFSLKRYQEGFPYFDRLLEVDPKSSLAHLGKARAYRDGGNLVAAYFAYQPVLNNDPRSASLREEVLEVATGAFGQDSPLTALLMERPAQPKRWDEGEGHVPSAEPLAVNPATPWRPEATQDPLSLLPE